jgi:hypothetical protein
MTGGILVTITRDHGFGRAVRKAKPAPVDTATHTLTLCDNEVFAVYEDQNKSDGYGGRSIVGYFTDLETAHTAARGMGVQGSLGDIRISLPVPTEVHAVNRDGSKTAIGTNTSFHPVSWESRLALLDPDTEPEQNGSN